MRGTLSYCVDFRYVLRAVDVVRSLSLSFVNNKHQTRLMNIKASFVRQSTDQRNRYEALSKAGLRIPHATSDRKRPWKDNSKTNALAAGYSYREREKEGRRTEKTARKISRYAPLIGAQERVGGWKFVRARAREEDG